MIKKGDWVESTNDDNINGIVESIDRKKGYAYVTVYREKTAVKVKIKDLKLFAD